MKKLFLLLGIVVFLFGAAAAGVIYQDELMDQFAGAKVVKSEKTIIRDSELYTYDFKTDEPSEFRVVFQVLSGNPIHVKLAADERVYEWDAGAYGLPIIKLDYAAGFTTEWFPGRVNENFEICINSPKTTTYVDRAFEITEITYQIERRPMRPQWVRDLRSSAQEAVNGEEAQQPLEDLLTTLASAGFRCP